jgi:hypothetical protein
VIAKTLANQRGKFAWPAVEVNTPFIRDVLPMSALVAPQVPIEKG